MEKELQKQKTLNENARANAVFSASNTSQRSNRQAAQIKSQAGRERESFTGSLASNDQNTVFTNGGNDANNQAPNLDVPEYHQAKQIPSSANQQNGRGFRGASESSARRKNTHSSHGAKDDLSNRDGKYLPQSKKKSVVNPLEESKDPCSASNRSISLSNATSSMQRRADMSLAQVSKGQEKSVSKKKKSRAGNGSGPTSSTGAAANHETATSQSKPVRPKKTKQNSQPQSDLSGNLKDDTNYGSSNPGARKATHKLGSASSGIPRNNAAKSENSRVASSIGEFQKPKSNAKDNLQKSSEGQQMHSTIKSRLSGRDLQNKTVSNWDKSQKDNESEKQRMMATTGALSPKAAQQIQLGRLESMDEGQLRDVKNSQAEAAHGQSEMRRSQDYQAANLPASPASQAPRRVQDLRPPSLMLNQPEAVTERDDESPSSPPVSAGPIIRDGNENSSHGFGIKLQKLQQPREANASGNTAGTQALTASVELTKQTTQLRDAHQVSTLIEAEPTSFGAAAAMAKSDSDSDDQNESKQQMMTEPLPILPKVTTVIHMPVKCPIENVRFIQLKRFLQFQKQHAEQMSAGYDLVGQRRKMIQMKTEDKIKKGANGIDDQEVIAKIDDTTHFIKSIVYARDPKIIDTEKQHVHQRDAFSHLNNVDVKMLVDKSKYLGEESKYSSLSPRGVNRHRVVQQAKPILDSQVYKLQDADDKTLLFESRFESGNLYLAQKVSDMEYNLLMSNDINTSGHTQWFFFQTRNTRAGMKVRFNILNYSKPDSLFNYGMKISVYSDKKSERKNIGWHKDCDDIRYFINGIRKDVTYYSKSYYTLTFTYKYEYDDDMVYFAYSQPYTYSDLRNDITAIETDPQRSKLMRKSNLCRTLSGEACEVLTITSADNLENFRNRKGVILTSRVHPGETVGSWMMRGCLTFLTDPENYEAKLLRENFVFKVIPMLNPDGVINGNYRCSLAGCDLNRRWKTPNKTLHPTIFHAKRLIKQIHQERSLVLFCDLHGHSRKQNVFMYGCNNKNNPGECRIFPFILGKMNKYFCYDYSRFGVQKSKEATARVALYKELKNVPNIFTMESSFAGIDFGPAAGQHLTSEMLETLGHDVCRSILIYANMYVPPELQDQPFFKNIMLQQQAAAKAKANATNLDKKNFKEPTIDIKNAINTEINGNAELLVSTGGDDSSSGSDSAPSEDNMQAEELVKVLPTADKTLKQQLKKNEAKRKQEEEKQAQSAVKLRRQSSGRNLKNQETSPVKRQMSPLKRPMPQPEKKEETKPEEKKKPKVETRDACTQTDRSDYQLIKQKMLRERKLKEEQAAQQLAQQKRGQPAGNGDMQKMGDYQQRPNDYVSKQQTVQMNTTQRLQQMMGINGDAKQRSGPQKIPINQHYHKQGSQPLKSMQGQMQPSPNSQMRNNIMQPKTQRSEVVGANQAQQLPGSSGNNPKLTIPEKGKYNFMGVSTLKQGQNGHPNGLSSHPQSANNDEYGGNAASMIRPTMAQSPMKQSDSMHSKDNMYHSQNVAREMLQDGMQMDANRLNKVDSRRSGNRGVSGNGTGELPAMTTLSGNTNSSFRDQQQYMNPGSGAAARMHPKNQNNFQIGHRNQNYDTEPSSHRQQPGIFSPQAQGGGLKAQFMLPQTKQLPQKEFVMMDVGQPSKGGNRKTSRNPKNAQNASITGISSGNFGNNKFGSQNNYAASQGSNNQMSRFSSQRAAQNLNNNSEQGLARNNSTHCAVAVGKYAGPLGSSPMTKVHNTQPSTNQSQNDQFSVQLTEISLSQPVVTRNPAVNQTVGGAALVTGVNASSHNVSNKSGSQQPLRASYNVQRTPQGKSGQWQNNSQVMENNNAHQYRGMPNSIPNQPQSAVQDHDPNCNKLPALNLRGPSKTGRQAGQSHSTTGSHQNASGVIGGLQIVLNQGQALGTPQQKMPFQIGQPTKFANSQLVSPSMQHMGGGQEGPRRGDVGHIVDATAAVQQRSQNPAIFSMGAAIQNSTNQRMQSLPFNYHNGSRTPSQHKKSRTHGHAIELVAPGGNVQGNLNLQTSPDHRGSSSYKAENSFGLEMNENQTRHPIDPQLSESIALRMGNQSEIADSRTAARSNYGTYDGRNVGAIVGQQLVTNQVQSVNKTPNMNFSKRSIISNASQGRVIGKRYSRH